MVPQPTTFWMPAGLVSERPGSVAALCICCRGEAKQLSPGHVRQQHVPVRRAGQVFRRLRLQGNRRLEREAAILEERGLPGLRGYLRDLHDDPKPTFKLKLLLAGPSMAGKSSLARALMGEARRLTDAVTERTIGLEIVRFVLPDPRGRALAGVEFIACELPTCSPARVPLRASVSICRCAPYVWLCRSPR